MVVQELVAIDYQHACDEKNQSEKRPEDKVYGPDLLFRDSFFKLDERFYLQR